MTATLQATFHLMLRSLRETVRQPAVEVGNLFIPVFFFFVTVGAIGGVTARAFGVDNYEGFQLPVAILQGVAGASSSSGLGMTTDIERGYFDKLLLTPAPRLALVLGRLAADGVRVLEVAPLVTPLPFPGGVTLDPHVWLDPVRMADAARIVAAALADVDPAAGFTSRGATVAAELLAADAEISDVLAGIPVERRLLVTNHETLQYFAARYGFTVIGVVVPGGSTLAEPSSAELAALVEVIRTHHMPAIFVETTSPSDLAAAVAAEVGTSVQVVELHTESLGEPGSPESSLAGMLVDPPHRRRPGRMRSWTG